MLMPYHTNCRANGNHTHARSHASANDHFSKHQPQRLAKASDNAQSRQETRAEGTA